MLIWESRGVDFCRRPLLLRAVWGRKERRAKMWAGNGLSVSSLHGDRLGVVAGKGGTLACAHVAAPAAAVAAIAAGVACVADVSVG